VTNIDKRTTLALKILPAAICCTLPLLSSHWRDALATEYKDDNPLGSAATDPNGQSVGNAIYATCITGANAEGDELNQRFQADCDTLVGGALEGDAGVAGALRSIAIDEISAQNQVASGQAQLQAAVVTRRLIAARADSKYEAYALNENPQLKLFERNNTGGGASADVAYGRIGAFANLQYAKADYDENDYAAGYDADITGLTAGADYRLSDSAILGAALNYGSANIDYDSDSGRLEVDEWGITLYGSYFLENGFFIDATAGYGRDDYNMHRKVHYTVSGTPARQTVESDPNGDRYSFSIGGGYDIARGGWTITPTARVDYIRNDVDSFKEKTSDPTAEAGGMAMSIDSEDYTSLTSNLGGIVSFASSQSWGVLVPQVHAEWVHEFDNDQQSIDGYFIADVNQEGFVVENTRPDRDYFNVGVGVSGQFAEGKSAFLLVDSILGYEDLSYYSIRGGVRMEF
jgi:outer membrane autotransporter protein